MSSTSKSVFATNLRQKQAGTDAYLGFGKLPAVHAAELKVLLVGRKTSSASQLCRLLKKIGMQPVFTSPLHVTSEYVKRVGPAIVLLDSSIFPGQRKSLVTDLLGSHSSIFYAYPIGKGFWWLPALLRGQDCNGASAFRTDELSLELKRLLQRNNPGSFGF